MISCRLLVLVILAAFTFVESLSLSAADDDRKAEYLDLRRLIGKENFKEAIARCKRLIDRYPDYLYLYETLAEVSLYADDLEEATRYFDGRIEEGLDVSLSYFGLGCVYYNKHNYEAAAICLERAIELGCKAPECHKYLEYAYEKLHGVDGAIRFFNSLCHRYPENANNWYALALAYWSKQDCYRVYKSIEHALSNRPLEPKFMEAKAAILEMMDKKRGGTSLINDLITLAEARGDLMGVQFLKSYSSLASGHFLHLVSARKKVSSFTDDAKELGLFRWVAWGLMQLADLEISAGSYEMAIVSSEKARKLAIRLHDEQLMLNALTMKFKALMELGDHFEAIQCAHERLVLSNRKGNEREYVRVLIDLAYIDFELGRVNEALDYAIKALNGTESLHLDFRMVFETHTILGLIYENLGKYRSALEHYTSATEAIKHNSLWPGNLAVGEGNLGNAYLGLRQLQKAKSHFHRQLFLAEKHGYSREVSYALLNLGNYSLTAKEFSLAGDYFLRGFRRSQELKQRNISSLCARALGHLSERNGRLEEALSWYGKAIESNISIKPAQGFPMTLQAPKRYRMSDYHNCVALYSHLGKITDAFHTSEQEKIQSTFDQKTLSAQRASRLAPDSMRARIVSIRSTLERKYAASLIRNGSIFLEGKEEDLVLRNDIESLEIEYRRILDTLKARDPGFYDFLEPSSISLKRIQNLVLASDQALLEYSVGEKHTELFLVKRDTLIHSTVRKTREELSELLGKMSYVLREGVGQQTVMNAALANFDRKTSSDLYALLIGPLENHLRETTRLIIVPDDVLRGLPFEALVSESTGSRQHGFRNAKFLLERFEVSYASAATNLDPRYAQKRRADRLLLALGDPVVPENGRRSPGDPKGIPDEPIDLRGLSPLPGARQEVECLSDIFGDQADVVVGEKALKSLFKELAPHYRILHLAAHATHDEQEPIYSSIHLSRAPEKQGSSALHTFELLNIDLNADLAVLSACNTGPNRSGNGGNELGRSLMLAGVPSVVSSLWTVEDKSTAELMARFYSYIKRGERKSKALQLAKLDLIRSGKPDPYHWAAFLLEGDTSPIDISGNSPPNWKLFAVLGIFVITSAVFLQRKQFISRIKTSAGFGKK